MDSLIQNGLSLLIHHDQYLLENDASERSITHRLGLYYQATFAGWDVDCEFNINLGGPKIIDIDPRKFLKSMANTLVQHYGAQVSFDVLKEDHVSVDDIRLLIRQLENPELEINQEFDILVHVLKLRDQNNKEVIIRKPVYPDIIVHRRGSDNNLVVIEAKKTTNKFRGARLYDMIKLKCLIDAPFNYEYAYFIDLPVGADYRMHERFEFKSSTYGVVNVTSLRH